jgi:hypothetical protein
MAEMGEQTIARARRRTSFSIPLILAKAGKEKDVSIKPSFALFAKLTFLEKKSCRALYVGSCLKVAR